MKSYQVAFLGGGVNSAVGEAHFSSLNLLGNVQIVAGCFSRDSDINKMSGIRYNVNLDRLYTSLEELIVNEKGKIDLIIILTPSNQHKEQVIKCIENNIPVICEKSLACDLIEMLEIENKFLKRKNFLAVIYNYLGYPMIRELKSLIQSNNFGKLLHIQIEMPQESFIRVNNNGVPLTPQNWRLKDGEIPTILLDLGVHLHSIIKYVTNLMPVNCVSTSTSVGNFSSIKDNISSMIEYENGMMCNMWVSKIASGNRNGLAIKLFGETGSAEWVQENPEILLIANNKGKKLILDRGSNDILISNLPRYTRFKAGHPSGFIEALANYYFDIFISYENYLISEDSTLTDCYGIKESIEGIFLLKGITDSSNSKKWEKIMFSKK
jgi:predicted dehydrogenase